MAVCRLCGKSAQEIGVYLKRVNPYWGNKGIWECYPSCKAKRSFEENLMDAIEETRDER